MNQLVTSNTNQVATADVRFYVDNALSANSRLAYKNDFAHFRAWGGTLPATPEQVASYISAFAGIHAIATLQRRLVSINTAHNMASLPSPVKSELVRLTFRGIRRQHGKAQRQVAPLIKEDLLAILRQMPDTKKGIRDKALLVIGFAAGLRRSEIVGLDVKDITFVKQGITINLRHSKTDKLSEGRSIAVPFGRFSVCPVQLLSQWVELLPVKDGAVFRSVAKGGKISAMRLSDRAVAEIVKLNAKEIGLNAADFSGHSIRSGLVTSCAMENVETWIIQKTTGHQSAEMLRRYIRPVEAFTYNASGFLF